jgi:Transglycosylase SLT domain
MSTLAPQPYEGWIEQAAALVGLPVALLREQTRQESGFNPGARSPAGALGIEQFEPATAASLGVNPLDPQASITAAAKLDAQYLAQYHGSVTEMLEAYNAGPGAVAQYGANVPYAETRQYVAAIEKAAAVGATVTPTAAGGGGLVAQGTGLLSDAAGAIAGDVVGLIWGAARPVVLTGVFVAAGVGVIGMGLWRAVRSSSAARNSR